MNDVANVPSFIWADKKPAGAASFAKGTDAVAAARQHLGAFATNYRLNPDQISDLVVRDLHDTGRGAIIVRFGRTIDGVEVLGELVSVAMNRNLDVIALSGFVTGDLPGVAKMAGKRARDSFTLGADRALSSAMSDLSGTRMESGDFEPAVAGNGGYQTYRLRAAGALRATAAAITEPARVKQVFYRIGPSMMVPAYYTEVDLGNDAAKKPRFFSYIIAGDSETVLTRRDLTDYDHPVTYRVWADNDGLFMPWDGPQGTDVTPFPSADTTFQPALVSPQLVTLSSLTSIGIHDPWLPPGATETLGNNVDAYLDLSAPDGFSPGTADFRGHTSSADTFDYTFDLTQSADASQTQRLAAVTQLFYDDNWFHDWYYMAGFTELAGNAQFSNYGRGGVEGDGIRAEAQDSSGFNNANMSTPADGGRPRMQMFLWTKPTDLRVTVTAPADLAGNFTNIQPANYGPLSFNTSAEIVRANPVDACLPLQGNVTGKIVFVDRGGSVDCNGFVGKIQRSQDAGAAGIIIGNVATSVNPETPVLMGGTPTETITISAISMPLTDANKFRTALAAGPVTGSLVRTTVLLDGDIDNQIIAHEWGHYISNRLVGNASGIDTNMARGMGEGWADFHAILITVRAEDTDGLNNDHWQGTYGIGAYATSSDPRSYYYGIRRYPYSTDMTKNPWTFKYISDVTPLPVNPPPHGGGATNSEVHNTGEIWTTMLWESYAALLNSGRYSFEDTRDQMRDYIVAGYKLTPNSPTLTEARDAILAAALANNFDDYTDIGKAFAKRGAGVNAVSPPRGENTNTPVIESYAWAPSIVQVSANITDSDDPVCASDNILDDGETATLHVIFRNVGIADTDAQLASVSTTDTGISFPDGTDLVVPPILRGGTGEATIHVAASGTALNTPYSITVTTPDAGAGENHDVTYTFPGNADEVAGSSNTDDAERTNSVWVNTFSVAGLAPSEMWHKSSSSASNHIYACRDANFAASSEFNTPQFLVAAAGNLTISFKHRFSFERDAINNLNFDAGTLEVTTDNGVTWTDIFNIPGNGLAYNGIIAAGNPIAGRPGFTGTSAGWPNFQTQNVNLGATFANKLVRIRFRVTSDGGVGAPGWEIDDITVGGSTVPMFPSLKDNNATCNNPPIANVGLTQSVPEFGPAPGFAPTKVFLDGSASFDPDGDPLTYRWTQLSGPTATLDNAGARIPSFIVPQITRTQARVAMVFQLIVNDGHNDSVAKQTQVTINNTNRPPVANAGPDQTVVEGTTVTLDGSGSSDPDAGDPALTFAWTAPAGVTLSDPTVAKPTFTAPQVDVSTPLTFTLTVSDGAATSTDSVTITVNNANRPPVANAGPDQTVNEKTVVTLDGSGSSDPDGDALTYAWTAPAGVTLSSTTAQKPTFTAPDVAANTDLTFSLVVTDTGGLSSTADSVTIHVQNVVVGNQPPVANAGPDITVKSGSLVTLHGSGTDPDGDAITSFTWTAPAALHLLGGKTATPFFVAPTVSTATTFTVSLVVTDGFGHTSAPDTAVITVNPH